MKGRIGRCAVPAAVLLAGSGIEQVLGSLLVGTDLLASVISGHSIALGLLAILLFGVRIVRLFLLPGWLLFTLMDLGMAFRTRQKAISRSSG